MKKNYTNPEFELISFESEDIMALSTEVLPTSLDYAKEGGLEDGAEWVG